MANKKIPFFDLKRQYKLLAKQVNGAQKRVFEKQFFILGEEVEEFEKEFARYLDSKYVVTVNSGTDALILSLRVLGIKPGDEIITQPNSFISTTLAITEIGVIPVFVDINPDTYQIDVSKIAEKITPRTRAILPVHLYGAPCEITKIMSLAKKNSLFVVEDACQAHGAVYNGKKVGTFGDIGVFSFYPSKNLGAYGDGGAVVTSSKRIRDRLLLLRNYGQTRKYHHKIIGTNSRLDELQAAILRVKLRYLEKWNIKRNQVAMWYKKFLKGAVKTQKLLNNTQSCYHLFVIESDERNKLQRILQKNNIETLIHYPVPIHLQECYKFLGYKKGDFPVAEKTAKRILSLPFYPELDKKEVLYVSEKIKEFAVSKSS